VTYSLVLEQRYLHCIVIQSGGDDFRPLLYPSLRLTYLAFHLSAYVMSRYSQAHQDAQGAGDGRPTALRIVEDEGLVGKLGDRTFLVTGVSSGIGIETMRALYATGAHVFGTARDMKKAQRVVDEVTAKTAGGKITLIEMDLASLPSVKLAAESFLRQSQSLNVLINNAG